MQKIFRLFTIFIAFLVFSAGSAAAAPLKFSKSANPQAAKDTSNWGYIVATRKYVDFKVDYAVNAGLETLLITGAENDSLPDCQSVSDVVLKDGTGKRTKWKCPPGVWYIVMNTPPKTKVSVAFEKQSTRYARRAVIKANKTVKPKTIVLRKTDLKDRSFTNRH